MKSFSASSFPTEQTEVLERARLAVNKDPLALFTDFQWFLFRARNVVYFTAFSTDEFDMARLEDTVIQMVSLAPQLTHGYDGARPGEPFTKSMVRSIATIEEIDDFDGYPDKWLEDGQRIFDAPELPLFRVKIVTRRGGADEQGRKSMIMVLSSHALMEGADSALLTRSQNSGHGEMSSAENKVPLSHRLKYGAIAMLTAPLHLMSGNFLAGEKKEMGFKSLQFSRHRLRRISNALGVNQRALMFAIVTRALNEGEQGFGKKEIKAVYTQLDTERQELDDDFFRVRALDIKFAMVSDLKTFIRGVENTISEVENKDVTTMQFIMNATFKAHRFLSKIVPFLYGPKFFRYNNGYDIVLTMVPPHRTYGDLTRGIVDPIYCGSYHPGSNLCVYVPARESVTFNFSAQAERLPCVDKIEDLLQELESEIQE